MKTKLECKPGITNTSKLICEKYWLRESDKRNGFLHTCKELSQKFGLRPQDIPKIVKNNAQLIVLDCLCDDCGTHKICHTRSELIQLQLSNWRCNQCKKLYQQRKEKELQDCKLEQRKLEQQQKQVLLDNLKNYRKSQLDHIPPSNELNVIDSCLLTATIESLGADNLKTTISLRDNLSLPLSPFFRMDEKILQHLFHSNLLLINPEDSFEYANINEQGGLEVDYHQVTFDFAYDATSLTKIIIKTKSKRSQHSLINDIEFKDWCQKIQLGECISYLVDRSNLNGLAPTINEKMVSLLTSCLTKNSVSEIYYMIWSAVENAAAYLQKPTITKSHASNSIYGNIKRNHDKIINGLWKTKRFNRVSNKPQPAVSKVFFEYIFGIEDCGFRLTLNELFVQFKPKLTFEEINYSTLAKVQNYNQSIKVNNIKIL